MSLIPSESYSFPDHFTSTRAASRKPKVESTRVPPQPLPNKPAIVALPDPKPKSAPVLQRPKHQPVQTKPAPPPPNPAVLRASAPPPRIPETPPLRKIPLPPTLKPKVRWNHRAPAMDPTPLPQNGLEQFQPPVIPAGPAQNVIPMKPAKAVSAPRVIARPAPDIVQNGTPVAIVKPRAPVMPAVGPQAVRQAQRSVAQSSPQQDFFQMFAESGETAAMRRRRKAKLRRFLVCEAAALAVLLPLAITGLTHRPSNVAVLWIMNIFTISSAVAAALIPILFYAFTPTLPEIER